MKKTRPITLYYNMTEEGAVILGIQGRASSLTIPETIEGQPVVAIGPYAFAVTAECLVAEKESQGVLTLCKGNDSWKAPSPMQEGDALVRLFLPDSIKRFGAYAFSGCSALQSLRLPEKLTTLPEYAFSGCVCLPRLSLPQGVREIGGYAFYDCRSFTEMVLPDGITAVGQYAFYNCRSMKKINIPKTAVYLETGMFLNCDSLYDISFGQCSHISDLIAVLNHELLLTIDFGEARARLLIPDFQYEYIEDTPARQFHQVNYGSGHLFRQCIGNEDIDFRRYDELFYLTKREDAAVLVLVLAVSRLSFPYRLQENRRETYLSYVKEHLFWAAGYYMEQEEEETLRLFAQWGLFTAENLPELISLAQKKKKTAIISFLMDYQHRFFPKAQKKTFEL